MQSHTTTIHISKTVRLSYLLHLPPGAEAEPGRRWPAILFLHGRGESGDDLASVLRQGLPPYVAQNPDFPFIVIAPQCPWNTWWPEQADGLDHLLDEFAARFPVNLRQLYLTGLSMGGYGTWYFGSAWPERFAALAPICGWGHWYHGFPERVCALKDTPVWAFHGARDDIIPLEGSEELVGALRACGGRVELTVYPEAGHDSWTAAYTNPDLYSWFLKHTRP